LRYNVIFRAEARDEALRAAEYIAGHGSPEVAIRWFDGLKAAVESLESMPTRYGQAREHEAFPGAGLRQIIYKSHRTIFVVRQNEGHVLHVRHVAQSDLDLTSGAL
jgi:plasmid stabilization system protein ParE